MKKPLLLCILDGFGWVPDQTYGNAILAARTPNLDKLFAQYPYTTIGASGMNVGLPDGQMGNSEVGHTNIGAGRIVYQELTRITKDIQDGGFFENPALLGAVKNAAADGKALHLIGLLSNGGVHSHNEHLYALLELARRGGVKDVYVHAIMDGRDVPPDSGKGFIEELEAKMGTSEADEPGFYTALRPVVFRAYKIDNEWFGKGKTVSELENYLVENDKRLFVERVRQKGVIEEVTPDMLLQPGDEVVLSGRREYAIGEEDWIGPEVIDAQLLDFPAETLPVMVTHRTFAGEKVSTIRALKFMHGVSIRSIKRAGINVPVLAQTVIDSGDILELTGTKLEVETAAKQMGYIDRPTNQTDMIFVGLGILLGGLVGALAIHLGGCLLYTSPSPRD